MFSARTSWPRDENPLTRAIDAARATVGADLIDLTISNPTAVALGVDEPAILTAIAKRAALTYEPQPFGLMHAREAVSHYYARRGRAVPPERIVLLASTSEAYGYLFQLLANPGETVAVPRPSYPLFTFLADLADVMLSPYHLRYGPKEGWRLDRASLAEAIDPSTRAIITVSPNNPTGSCANEVERRHLVKEAAAKGIAIISDEVFLDYLTDPRAIDTGTFVGTEDALTFSLSGISKVAGLPQMKLSWIVLSGPDDLVKEASERLEIIADAHLSVSAPIQHALPEILRDADSWQTKLRARIEANRTALAEILEGTSCSVRISDGGWYAILDLPGAESDEEWALALIAQDRLVVHPGYLFDIEETSALVISLILLPERFREGIERLRGRVLDRGL